MWLQKKNSLMKNLSWLIWLIHLTITYQIRIIPWHKNCTYLYILKVDKARWQKHITMSLECLPLLFAKIPSKMHSRTRMHLFLLPAWFKGPFFSFWHNQLGYSRNVQKSNKNRFFPIGTFHENFPIISSRNLFVEGQFWLILDI